MTRENREFLRRHAITVDKAVSMLAEPERDANERGATLFKGADMRCVERHDALLPCPTPGCGGQARIHKDMSGYYYVCCTKCGHSPYRHEVTEYWAAKAWNDEALRLTKKKRRKP